MCMCVCVCMCVRVCVCVCVCVYIYMEVGTFHKPKLSSFQPELLAVSDEALPYF